MADASAPQSRTKGSPRVEQGQHGAHREHRDRCGVDEPLLYVDPYCI